MWYLALATIWYAAFAIWVLVDSRRRLNNPVGWTVGTLILGPVVLPVYFAKRHLKSRETREGGTAWNILRNFALFWTIAMAVAAIIGATAVSEQSATLHGDAEKAGFAIGTALGLGLIGALWFFPMVGAVVLGFLLKKSSVVEKGPTGPLSVEGGKLGDLGAAGWVAIAALTLLTANVLSWSAGKVSPASSGQDATGTGDKWQVQEGTSPMDGSKTVTLTLRSEDEVKGWLESTRPSLVIRCREKETDAYVVTGIAANPEIGAENFRVRLRFDNGVPVTEHWSQSTDSKGLFASNARQLSERLAGAKTLTFQFTPFNASAAVARFNLQGLGTHLDKVANGCGWKAGRT
jgi:hypothetical protein